MKTTKKKLENPSSPKSKTTSSQKTSAQPKKKIIHYNVEIGNFLFKLINDHIHFLKNSKNDINKKDWVAEAIREKLQDPESEEDQRTRYLHLQLETDLFEEIDKKMEFLKAFRRSVSKKQWIIEAIFEKLEREEH
ncbi:hypothetical protein [Candidatus Protochlamydia amoebophila]|uniref:Uncharacterized protein n=1 Tax=Protochlamydia amoebophila (strain UWE25) TaxID=264201 RepID=Q6MBA5_PARUW|nr:hypothetical protein [Candidatus Protochlamydia amoebophila]CAF24144.1 unnamed protein product [Candidatus Protochlamydia amoebophila UWE25]